MTAPLTPHGQPPHEQPGHNPWQYPPASGGGGKPTGGKGGRNAGGEDDTDLAGELWQAFLLMVGVAALGLLLGFLWEQFAPRVPLVVRGGDAWLKESESEDAISIDGTFALLGLAFGAVTALAVFLWRRRGGLPLVLGLALGSLIGAVVAWRFGIWLGPPGNVAQRASEMSDGSHLEAPLELKAKGALLAWPGAAMAVHLVLTGLFGPRDPEPQAPPPPTGGWQGWGSPTS
ncbi:hypothetical protein [Streptomyces sp. CMB-StM0423]|uniref:hypothetical protein n=1 Tax=Streptomyces sp. CMB-StM0423 TaxID=2059884 RepID=UPI000C70807E|nr:hypothetical protein [Streptomyces sp. CMB-StM0423]AUH45186.1 hypothetical protein CXR04_28180 [Streptomyces sp. CMB-StM0423]